MVSNQDAYILLFEFIDNALDILNGNRVNSGKRLVKHDELRVDGQTAGNFRASAFPAAESVAIILSHFLKIEFRNQSFKFFALFFLTV